MSDDTKTILGLLVGVVAFFVLVTGIIGVERYGPASLLACLSTLPYWVWLIRSTRLGAPTFPLHYVWFDDKRSVAPYVYYCPECGRRVVYRRVGHGKISYDVYSGKKKDEREYEYYTVCSQHGAVDAPDGIIKEVN